MTPRFGIVLGACLGLGLSPACGGEARQAKAEAAAVARAVAALRAAPNDAKASFLPGLKQAACKDPEVCELRRVCLSAYETHVRALDATGTVKSRLDADAAASEGPGLVALLAQAERELLQSRELADQCANAEGSLRRRFKL